MYLTEKSLYNILSIAYPNANIQGQFKIKKYRYDYIIDNHTLVEFDGFIHYNSYKQQFNDKIKDELAKENNYKLIRIPYFVQPCTEFFSYYFNKNIEHKQTYDHGFIDKKALTPWDFNEIGSKLYKRQIEDLPINIKKEIEKSLLNHNYNKLRMK
jgi:glycyl-tRNA synthetase alpha subunit